MIKRADRSSWKTLPDPDLRVPLDFRAQFSWDEAEMLRQGLIPKAMEDKWFVFEEDAWLRFCRSWTGTVIFAIRLEETEDGASVAESWVSRDGEQYGGTDCAYERELLHSIIDALLLGKPTEFPRPANVVNDEPGVLQHHFVGRAYPERDSGDGA